MIAKLQPSDPDAAACAQPSSLGQHVSEVRPPFQIVIAILVVCVVAMAVAAGRGSETATASAAACAASLLIGAGVLTNLATWRASPTAQTPPVNAAIALQRSTVLTALAYAWGSLALFTIYLGTPLSWQHGWQYASVMAIIAVGHVVFLRHLAAQPTPVAVSRATKRAVMLACLQGTATVVAMVWLVMSGKLGTLRDDWAANTVFLAGGTALAVLSAIIVVTHIIAERRR